MKNVILFAGLFLLIMTGCKKDDDCDLSSERLVGTYKLTGLSYKTAASPTPTDIYSVSIPPCERDDLYSFNANGTAIYTDAGTRCVPTSTFNATWSLSGNVLTFDGDNYTVASFDCSAMVVSINDPSTPGDVYTFTYVRQ